MVHTRLSYYKTKNFNYPYYIKIKKPNPPPLASNAKRVGSERLQGAIAASIGGNNSSTEQIVEHIGGINTTHATNGSSGRGHQKFR
jgi:hypothetical protein